MEGYRISRNWLTRRLGPNDHEWSSAVEDREPEFDEPAPPGVNAGVIGIAVVRNREPIRTTLTSVH
jgi:hypothetical protein